MRPNDKTGLTRRSMLAGAAGATAAALTGGMAAGSAKAKECCSEIKTYQSADFYDAQGNFLEDKAKQACHDMFERFGYRLSDKLREEMWALDFGLGDFAKVGLAGIFWINRQDYSYFGHEIFLLPGQMIAEHRHAETPLGPAKMESWQPRHGMVYAFGEGDPSTELLDKIPASQREIVHSRHCTPLEVDEMADLNRLNAWHYLVAGDEGALVTEYGTFHDMDGVQLSNPKAHL